MKKRNKKEVQQDLIEWGRMEVARLFSRGKSINDSHFVKLDPRTIYSDQKYIRDDDIVVYALLLLKLFLD
jgi:hypothetical protein